MGQARGSVAAIGKVRWRTAEIQRLLLAAVGHLEVPARRQSSLKPRTAVEPAVRRGGYAAAAAAPAADRDDPTLVDLTGALLGSRRTADPARPLASPGGSRAGGRLGTVDTGDLELLRGPAGRALLDAAVAGLDRGEQVLPLATALRRAGSDPALVAAALTQAQLRVRGRTKFGPDADRMFWTAAGLEQSTRAVVAGHRAARYAQLAPDLVADLCCGVGGDMLAMARAGLRVLGVDTDQVTAATARANAAQMGLSERVTVRVDDVTSTDLSGVDAVFVDPARRTASGRRRFDPQAYSPPLSFALELAHRVPATCVKVAPGVPHELVPGTAEAEWVSVDGDLKEAALWFGPLGRPGRRRATLLTERGLRAAATLTADTDRGAAPVAAAGDYLHEPDAAVIRAGLVAVVAEQLGGWLLDPTIAYVSTDSPQLSAFTRRYRVEDVVPFQLKRLRALLRARGVGDVVVKKRGTAVQPEELRRQLRLDGTGPTRTLVLTRVAGAPIVLLVDPA